MDTHEQAPDLHAFTPVTHVLPQQQVVGCRGDDEVEYLFEYLVDYGCVEAVSSHQVHPGRQLQRVGSLSSFTAALHSERMSS